jgi:hypothetical protein
LDHVKKQHTIFNLRIILFIHKILKEKKKKKKEKTRSLSKGDGKQQEEPQNFSFVVRQSDIAVFVHNGNPASHNNDNNNTCFYLFLNGKIPKFCQKQKYRLEIA